MNTVYIDRKQVSIEVQGDSLRVRPAPRGCGNIPLKLVSRLVLLGEVQLNSRALGRLGEAGIAVICLSGRAHRRVAQLCGPPGRDGARRLHQYRAALDEEQATDIARKLVAGKLSACQRELHALERRRPAARRSLFKARDKVETLIDRLADTDLPALRGHEGAGAAAWFTALAAVLPPSLGFSGRNRRPPRDPVNAVLSLAYTLIQGEAVASCHAHGLDPMIGFLHEPAHGRESLACDLIEPLRPRIDVRVLEMFSRKVLRANHFTEGDSGCRLRKNGRARFWPWWESVAPPLRRYLRTRGHELVRDLSRANP